MNLFSAVFHHLNNHTSNKLKKSLKLKLDPITCFTLQGPSVKDGFVCYKTKRGVKTRSKFGHSLISGSKTHVHFFVLSQNKPALGWCQFIT